MGLYNQIHKKDKQNNSVLNLMLIFVKQLQIRQLKWY